MSVAKKLTKVNAYTQQDADGIQNMSRVYLIVLIFLYIEANVYFSKWGGSDPIHTCGWGSAPDPAFPSLFRVTHDMSFKNWKKKNKKY